MYAQSIYLSIYLSILVYEYLSIYLSILTKNDDENMSWKHEDNENKNFNIQNQLQLFNKSIYLSIYVTQFFDKSIYFSLLIYLSIYLSIYPIIKICLENMKIIEIKI